MKKLVKIIQRCADCPNIYLEYPMSDEYVCLEANKEVRDSSVISDWCPLPEEKEKPEEEEDWTAEDELLETEGLYER